MVTNQSIVGDTDKNQLNASLLDREVPECMILQRISQRGRTDVGQDVSHGATF